MSGGRSPSEAAGRDEGLAERYERVVAEIAEAAHAAGRRPRELTTIVVTKFHPAELVRELVALGHRDFGENRHQEAAAKAAALRLDPLAQGSGADLDPRWHFIGQLQSNKAKAVAGYAASVHSLDRDSVRAALAGTGLDVFIQVNLTEDPGRGGVAPADIPAFAERVLATEGVSLRGLMAVAGLGKEPAAEFERVRELSEALLLPIAPEAAALSMGMSGDFPAAIREGATHLRIGTAITGKRPDPT